MQIQFEAGLNYNLLRILGYLCISGSFHFLYVAIVELLGYFNCSEKVILSGDFNWSDLVCFRGELWHTFSHWVDGSYPEKAVVCGLPLAV